MDRVNEQAFEQSWKHFEDRWGEQRTTVKQYARDIITAYEAARTPDAALVEKLIERLEQRKFALTGNDDYALGCNDTLDDCIAIVREHFNKTAAAPNIGVRLSSCSDGGQSSPQSPDTATSSPVKSDPASLPCGTGVERYGTLKGIFDLLIEREITSALEPPAQPRKSLEQKP